MDFKNRIGIIGCGAVTQKNYLPGLAYFPEKTLARVHDLNRDTASRVATASGAEVSGMEQILEDCGTVVIATPPGSHAALVEKVLSAGRTVICEKPFVGTRSDASRLADLAKERNSSLFVGHVRRCYPSVRLARSLVGSGMLGRVTGLTAYEGGRFTWQAESGYVYTDPLGGVLFDTGSHTIDTLLYAAGFDTGEVGVAVVETRRDRPEPSNDIEARVSLSRDGVEIPVQIKLSRVTATANKLRIDCESGFVDIPVGLTNYVRIGGPEGKAVIVHSRESYNDGLECFAVQLKRMFYPDEERTFSAERFVNLSALLECVSKDDVQEH